MTDLPLVWHDGRIIDAETPIATALDHGVLLGDGLFEAIVIVDGVARHLDRHLARLRRGLAVLDIEGSPDDDELRSAINGLVAASGRSDGRLRITVTAGDGISTRRRGARPNTFLTFDRPVPTPTSVTLLTSPWPRNERSPFAGIKSTNWAENAAALRLAAAHGFDNALFLDTRGRVSECATANVHAVMDGIVCTPPLGTGCLAGIAREVLLHEDIEIERELTPADLRRADTVFITSSTTGPVPVTRIDDDDLPVDPEWVRRIDVALENG